jgi:hypothetical protein
MTCLAAIQGDPSKSVASWGLRVGGINCSSSDLI